MTGPGVPPKINPHEYNDEKYKEASRELYAAALDLWKAGATLDDIRRELEESFNFIYGETA